MRRVQLNPGLPGGSWAVLRPLNGHDEAFVDGVDAIAATNLVDRLIVEAPGTCVGRGRAWDLALCDRDRLLAAVYRDCFGDRIECVAACSDCGKPFDMAFSLGVLIDGADDASADGVHGPDEDGFFTLVDGARFRLPTANDLCGAMEHSEEDAETALIERCVVDGDIAVDPARLEAAMAAVGPMLVTDLDATCPNCDSKQSVQFDIQSHLLRALAQERRFLTHEIHWIARTYGWSIHDILSLPREDRRSFVSLIESDRGPRRRTLQ